MTLNVHLWAFFLVVVSNIFYFHSYLRKIPILIYIFQISFDVNVFLPDILMVKYELHLVTGP